MACSLLSARSEREGHMWFFVTVVIIAMFVLAIAGFQASMHH